ncbi:MAG: 23S rRNA (adenine(2503)-C(2))-methyltransferase RlmN [Chlamydiae bacterium]|nr:23S rRNA (adenine(2503)-C(2))-methyltransferase RlmN [Chlamydiota bacterium]
MLISIFSHTAKEYAELVSTKLGRGYSHALKLYTDWFQRGMVNPEASWIEPQARALVQEMILATDFSLPLKSEEKKAGDLIKFLLRFGDGLESESVLIPMQFGTTLCISSQVGCRMGCSFCETGKMGLLRNLSEAEIVSQVFCARHIYGKPVRNIVFMGMGEPLDNFDAVMQAVKILTCSSGLAFGPSRITISTSGVVDHMYRFMQEADPALNLAVSVNAPSDEIRSKIMPVNKKWNMADLKECMEEYCKHPRRQILAEYVLIEGVNDSLSCADLLAEYLQDLRVKVNLIPYNSQSRDRFSAPALEVREAFLSRMREKGYQTLLRGSKGQNIMAACGQLGNKEQRKKLLKLGSS